MAAIEKRTDANGNTSYRVKVRLKGQPVQSATFDRLTDAKRWGTQTEAAIREGRHFKHAEAKKRTLADAIARYRRDLLPALKDSYGRGLLLNWWEHEAGALFLADLTPAKVGELRDKLKATPITSKAKKPAADAVPKMRSDASANRYLAALSTVLTACVMEWEWMDANPCERVTKGKESRGRVRFLSNEERIALMAACEESKTPELRIIVWIALTTGARKGEILALRWRRVDMARHVLVLDSLDDAGTKNGETRSVPLVSHALDAMRDWAKVRPLDGNALVFPGRTPTTKDTPLDIERAWQTAMKRAGLVDFHFHDLRHTAASYLAMNGAGLREIADILGHKTLAMVQRYSHLTESHKTATIQRMTDAMYGGGK